MFILLCFLKRVITIPNSFIGAVIGVAIQWYQFRNSVLNLRISQGTMSARTGTQVSHYNIWAQSISNLLSRFTKPNF